MTEPGTFDFDLVVLGAGTGGYTAAFRAAQLGLSVALVDEAKIGGTCLHRGCIPTKTILESAELLHRLAKARELGIQGDGAVGVDYGVVLARRDQIVKRGWTGLRGLVKKNGIEWVQGRGRLDGGQTLVVDLLAEDGSPAGERVIRARDIIVATGSRPKSLPGLVPDGTAILTSDDVLRRESLPASIVIVGGGAIGVEFASLFHDFGTQVTLLEYLSSLVPAEDAEIGKELEKSFARRGVKVITSARFDPGAVRRDAFGVALEVAKDGAEGAPLEVRAEIMLVATGRAANLEGIGLESTAAVVERGAVVVDASMQTAEPHLYAVGDMIGGLLLAHTAGHEGLIAAHAIAISQGRAGVEPRHAMDYVLQPRATYSRPEIASIGLTEQQCADRGIIVKIGKVPFMAITKAVIGGDYEGFGKVIADAGHGKVLGIHLIGPHATDLIGEASVALTLGSTAADLGGATHPHPTLSEVIAEASLALDGRSINF